MKRYDFANDVQFVYVSDLHAWALRHKATVEGMEHHRNCSSNYDYFDGECNCPRGDALREIEELL